MSLATSSWIPYYESTKDSDINYLLNIILDSYHDFILIIQNDDVKNIMLKILIIDMINF